MNNCPICFSQINLNNKILFYPVDFDKGKQKKVFTEIHFCPTCNVGVAFPEISEKEMQEYYVSGHYWQNAKLRGSLKDFPVPYTLAKIRWKIIEEELIAKKRKNISILDIGAGFGCIGMVAGKSRKVSLDRYVMLEPDLKMHKNFQMIRQKWKIKSEFEAFDSLEKVSGKYDVVVLSHVLEHLREPQVLLKKTLLFLNDGGILLVDVPNQDYLFKRDVFPHVIFFNLSSMKSLLEKEKALKILSLNVYGVDMKNSPMSYSAPLLIKLINKVLGKVYHFIPINILILFYSYYFGMSKINTKGIWIRALCEKSKIN